MDVTNILACVETVRKNMRSDTSRRELQDQDGLDAESQNVTHPEACAVWPILPGD